MSDATANDVHQAAVPKSDQLNADDLIGGPMTVTVESVRKGSKEQPIIVELEGHKGKPWKPSKGMIRVLIAAWTEDPYEWVGKRLTLFRNPDVKYAGVKVGGIEISHMSDIANDTEFTKTVTRGVRVPFIVKKLDDKPAPPTLTEAEQKYVEDAAGEIQSAESIEMLKAIGFTLKGKSEAVRNALRPTYDTRKKELES